MYRTEFYSEIRYEHCLYCYDRYVNRKLENVDIIFRNFTNKYKEYFPRVYTIRLVIKRTSAQNKMKSDVIVPVAN